MATRSSGKEKRHWDEALGGPKKENAGTCRTGNQYPVPLVLTAPGREPLSSDPVRSSAAGSLRSVAILAGEDPAPTSETCLPAEHSSAPQGRRSPRVYLTRIDLQMGCRSEVGQAPEATELPGGRSAQSNSRRSNRPKTQPLRKRAAASLECPQPLGVATIQSSSPRSEPCTGYQSQASPQSRETHPGPAFGSQIRRGPALRSGSALTGKAPQHSAYALGPALGNGASAPDPAPRSQATVPGPVRGSVSKSGRDVHRRATRAGLTCRSRASRPGLDRRRRAAASASPAPHSRARGSGCAFRSRATPRGPVRRGRSSSGSASGSSPDGLGRATRAGRAFCSRATPPGRVLRSSSSSSASGPGCIEHGLAISPSRVRSSNSNTASSPGLVQCTRGTLPGPVLHRSVSGSGPDGHGRATRAGLALHSGATLPGPVRSSSRNASPPGFVEHSHATPPGPVLCSSASRSGPNGRGRATRAGLALRSRTSRPGSVLRSSASQPGLVQRTRATLPGRVHSTESGSSSDGCGPARSRVRSRACARARAPHPRPAVQSSPSCGSRSRTTQGRSALPSLRALPVGGRNHSAQVALRKPVQAASLSLVPEAGNPPSPPVWHAVRMRASSPSPPGRYFPLHRLASEQISSSAESPGQSPSSSSPKFSGQSPSSCPRFCGLRSIRTPSPDSLRRALLPELDSLTATLAEQEQVEDLPSSPIPPVVSEMSILQDPQK
ncbi:PREDICTED: uncharacterized protein CXorf67-like [Chinchilla lanigera]|uniref:uncharacterized protein CXorf67-like n=1 Tax=Chinchilla lanigera TaxID=34839 RepID=UPI000695F933|nr:PREDICTED: uncharacterized protein CXorf67-like [Chinchilla lanigera]